MLKRLEWIKDCGIFEDYKWENTVPDFERINVIYGPNGSGKTSLSRALGGLRNSPEIGPTRISVLVDAVPQRSTSGKIDPAFARILVFNDDFIGASHDFKTDETTMSAILTIGQRDVESDKKIDELEQELENELAKKEPARQEEKAANKFVNNIYSQISQQVVDGASGAGGRWKSRGNFTAGVVKRCYLESERDWNSLPPAELQEKMAFVSSPVADPLPTKSYDVQLPGRLLDRVMESLAISPTAVVLDTLAVHPDASGWVDQGRKHHQETEQCIYCSSPLTEDRKNKIEAHFSDEVEVLKESLRVLSGEVRSSARRLDEVKTELPDPGLLALDLRGNYEQARTTYLDQLRELKNWLTGLEVSIGEKLENPLRIVTYGRGPAPSIDSTLIEKLRDTHNSRIEKHGSLVYQAAVKIEHHYLKEAEKEVIEGKNSLKTKSKEVSRIESSIKRLQGDVQALKNVEGDPRPSAEVLNREVSRLLGRSELRFETVGDRYTVTRNEKPAVGLSVGERTAITLIHFFEMVARWNPSDGKPIVVVDDPVSSLDSNVFMGISTYIWNEAVAKDHISQLILLTHNFELFRQWDIQLDGLHRNNQMKKLFPAKTYEITSRHRTKGGVSVRTPYLVSWPPSQAVRKKMRSSYHHAFMATAEAKLSLNADDSMDKRLDAQLLFPNVVRRLLESFLAFKIPESVGDFNGTMRKSVSLLEATGFRGDADALRIRLTRYTHANSHSESPSTDAIISPDEVGPAISAAFEFMYWLDVKHFTGICKVLGLEVLALVPMGSVISGDSSPNLSRGVTAR